MALYYVPKFHEKSPIVSQGDIVALDKIKLDVRKIDELEQMLEVPKSEINERQRIMSELRELLRKYYPDCQLYIYGSSMNGLGFRGSDLDILFLPFPSYCNLDFVCEEKPTIPEPSSILTGAVERDVLLKFDEFSHLKFIRSVLRHEKEPVKKVVFIPAKSPLLRINLSNSNIVCDLSASNRLVVFNTELLQFFVKLDPRVRVLIRILKFWARTLGFLKRSFFSSYAFTLLIIFFLQTVSPPLLPSVESIIKAAGFSRTVAGWQTSFSTDMDLAKKIMNTSSVGNLMQQFFEYYWNFDFAQNVVSPYTGKVIPVTELKNSGDERMAYFEVSSINIQDPFILNRNVCKKEGPRNVFKLCLVTAYGMMSELSKFSLLFDVKEYQKVLDLHYDKYMYGRPKVCFINFDHVCIASLKKYEENSLMWYEKVSQTLFDVLQYGLLIECDVTDKVFSSCVKPSVHHSNNVRMQLPSIASHMNGKPDLKSSPYDLELLISIQCVLYTRTWIGRKTFTDITVKEEEKEFLNAALNTEFCISKELVRKNPAINSPVPLLCFKCDCYKHSCSEIADLIIMLKPLTYSREFHQVSAFLASYVPKTVKKIIACDYQ